MFETMRNATPEERLALSYVANQKLARLLDEAGQEYETETVTVTVGGKERSVEGVVVGPKYSSIERVLQKSLGMSEAVAKQLAAACKVKGDDWFEKIDDKNMINAHGTMKATYTNGFFDLFDNPISLNSAVSLSIGTAKCYNAHSDSEGNEPVNVMEDRELIDVLLSPEQWVRVLRSQAVSVPCTIGRSNGYLHDRPLPLDLEEVRVVDDLEETLRGVCKPISDAALTLNALLEKAPITSKKAMAELDEAVDALAEAIEQVTPEISQKQQDAIDELVGAYSRRLKLMVDKETKRLPESLRSEATRYLPKLTD